MGVRLLGGLIAWVAIITTLHVYVNSRVPAGGTTARTIEVGGLPVT